MRTTRRSLLAGTGAAAALAGAGRGRAQDGTIRLGMVTSLSGAQELLGKPMLIGAQIAAERINAAGGVIGRRIEIVARDDRGDPNQSLALGRELIGNGINLILGLVISPGAIALTSIMPASNAILMTCAAHSDRLTHELFNRHYFRVTDNPPMRQHAEARLMAERYPDVTTWGAVLPDVEYGRSAWAAFKDGLQTFYPQIAGKDVTIVEPVWAKFGASDYQSQISALVGSPIQGMFNAVYGGDAAAMFQQSRPYGLEKKLKVIADSANEWILCKALGRSLPANLWTGSHWYFGGYLDTTLGKKLYGEWVRRTGDRWPMGVVQTGHAAVLAYAAAIARTGGTETGKIIDALEELTLDTAKGSLTFRKEDHQAICDVNIYRPRPSQSEPGFEVAEFVRVPGAEVIEPPSPGKELAYRAGG